MSTKAVKWRCRMRNSVATSRFQSLITSLLGRRPAKEDPTHADEGRDRPNRVYDLIRLHSGSTDKLPPPVARVAGRPKCGRFWTGGFVVRGSERSNAPAPAG